MEDWQHAGFGVYIHWPFCLHKCPYCDFNSHVAARIDEDRWRQALVSEIGRTAALVPGRRVDTVFFGGGTPSLMSASTVSAIIMAISDNWPLAADAEITLEANPTSVEASRFRDYRAAGINRVSMGLQALNDPDLRKLGRVHTALEAMQAFEVAKKIFSRTSLDLIYARQDQTIGSWQQELTQALELATDHLSLYQLTIEDNTVFGARAARGQLRGLPDQNLSADMFLLTRDMCEAAGMPAYEVSNHARPGAQSRHNLIYWRYGDYAGIGPGAHGRLTVGGAKLATSTPLDPKTWLMAAESGHDRMPVEHLSPQDQAAEYLLMSLRLDEGSDLARFRRLGGSVSQTGLSDLEQEGFLDVSGDRVRATRSGVPVLNAVIARLLA